MSDRFCNMRVGCTYGVFSLPWEENQKNCCWSWSCTLALKTITFTYRIDTSYPTYTNKYTYVIYMPLQKKITRFFLLLLMAFRNLIVGYFDKIFKIFYFKVMLKGLHFPSPFDLDFYCINLIKYIKWDQKDNKHH